jgi:hypothetical protein
MSSYTKVAGNCTYKEEESFATVLHIQSQQQAPHEENAAMNNANGICMLRKLWMMDLN